MIGNADSFIPNASGDSACAYCRPGVIPAPLLWGCTRSGASWGGDQVPSVQNGDVSPDARTWTFHLRPHLVWSDGQPYDARDVDFTWRLWANPKFGAGTIHGSEPDYLGRYFGGPPHDHLPPHASLCAICLAVGRWLSCATTRAPFQIDSTRGHQQVARQPEPQGHQRPVHDGGEHARRSLHAGAQPPLLPCQRRAALPGQGRLPHRAEQDTILKDLQAGTPSLRPGSWM